MKKHIDLSVMKRTELEEYAAGQAVRAETLEAEVRKYRELFKLGQAQQFAPKSEKSDTSEQVCIFDEAEEAADLSATEPSAGSACPPKKKVPKRSKGTKAAQLAGIKRETIELTLSDEEAVCTQCGGPLHGMNTVTRKEIEILPPQIKVKQYVQTVYACRNCEKQGTGGGIVSAPAPRPLLKNSLVSPSALAWLISRKYLGRDTLYQIENELRLQGAKLSRQTLANWIVIGAKRFLSPLCEELRKQLLTREVVNADETPVQVLHEEGRNAKQKSYMWVFRSGEGIDKPMILFHYAPSRSGDVAVNFLEGFQGKFLQSDGYSGYSKLEDQLIRVGCLSHVRRYYMDVLKACEKDGGRAYTAAEEGVARCNALFAEDATAAKLGHQEEAAYKEATIKPLLEDFLRWAQGELACCPKSTLLYKALYYTVNQQVYLRNYLQNPGIRISNNVSEREIRPFVMGRKMWLFCNTANGANASAACYSIVQTALANGLDPYKYLLKIFELSRGKMCLEESDVQKLLPWNEEIQNKCSIGKNEQEN